MKVLVTGASGFVGRAICAHLTEQGLTVVGAVRHLPENRTTGVDYRIVPDINGETNWSEALTGINAVIHCAARVHIMQDTADDPLVAFRAINLEGTIRLVNQAVEGGLKRFVYLSSLKLKLITRNMMYQVTSL